MALITLCMDVLRLTVQPTKKRKSKKVIFRGNVQEKEGWHCGCMAAKCDTLRPSNIGSLFVRKEMYVDVCVCKMK